MAINKKEVFKCVDCGEKFEYGDWEGCKKNADGPHPVKVKVYYSKYAGYNHEWKMGRALVDAQGNKQNIRGKRAQFQGGEFHTDDPEAQAFLDGELEKGVLITLEKFNELKMPANLRNKQLQKVVADKSSLVKAQAARIAELEAAAAGRPRRKSA